MSYHKDKLTLIAISRPFLDLNEATIFAKRQRKNTPDVDLLVNEVGNGKGHAKRKKYTVVRPATRQKDKILSKFTIIADAKNLIGI